MQTRTGPGLSPPATDRECPLPDGKGTTMRVDYVVMDALWWALVWGLKAVWAAACFYVPWQFLAAAERRLRAGLRDRRESVAR